jgi:hypothetical protein
MPQYGQGGKANAWISYHEPEVKGNGKRRVIPRSQLRQMAKMSSAGGRARCFFCHESFSMTYMRPVKVTLFTEELVCADCRADHNL